MRKKNDVKKKKEKREAETGMGYWPISVCAGSRYNSLYCDRKGWEAGLGAMTRPDWRATRPMILPQQGNDTGHGTAGPHVRASCARARAWLLGDCVAIRMGVS